jgi:hypothetical protein
VRRLRTPGQQAALASQERGNLRLQQGYTSFPWNTHPDDRYIRVFPDGPYSQKWDGIQKVNLISTVGVLRSARYTPEPAYLQEYATVVPHTQQVNWAAYSQGAGPAVIAQQQAEAQQQAMIPPSFWGAVMARIRGQQ